MTSNRPHSSQISSHTKLSKFLIAKLQLDQAINLYLEGKDFVSSVTLSGAADEILGKICKSNGDRSALEDIVSSLSSMYKYAFDEDPPQKEFVKLRNRARNEFKHATDGEERVFDLEQEAVNMIQRAMANYLKLVPGDSQKFSAFNKERVRRWRLRNSG